MAPVEKWSFLSLKCPSDSGIFIYIWSFVFEAILKVWNLLSNLSNLYLILSSHYFCTLHDTECVFPLGALHLFSIIFSISLKLHHTKPSLCVYLCFLPPRHWTNCLRRSWPWTSTSGTSCVWVTERRSWRLRRISAGEMRRQDIEPQLAKQHIKAYKLRDHSAPPCLPTTMFVFILAPLMKAAALCGVFDVVIRAPN